MLQIRHQSDLGVQAFKFNCNFSFQKIKLGGSRKKFNCLPRVPSTFFGVARQHRRTSSKDVCTHVWPFDVAWDIDSQSLASNLFASSIIPYAGFLYHLQKSKKAPKLMLIGFYFLLVFVFATIVAGVTAKLKYNSILANVDWLHGSAESFLTITNLLIVLGLRQGIVEAEKANLAAADSASEKGKEIEENVEQKT